MTKNYKKYLVLAIATVFLIGGTGVRATSDTVLDVPAGIGGTSQVPPGVGGSTSNIDSKIVKLDNPIKANNIKELLILLVDFAILIGSIIAVLVFIYIGFQFVMAQGNSDKINDAKKWFLYAVIGTALLLGSKVVVDIVQNTIVSTGLVNKEAIMGQ